VRLDVLVAGLLVSNLLKTGLDWIFGSALVIFVIAGAIDLIAKAIFFEIYRKSKIFGRSEIQGISKPLNP